MAKLRKLAYFLLVCLVLVACTGQGYAPLGVARSQSTSERTDGAEATSVVALAPTEASVPTTVSTETQVPTNTSAPPPPTPTPAFLEPDQVPSLTLDDIFPPRELTAMPLDPSRLRTLVTTGDIIPGGNADYAIRTHGDDFLFPVAATKDILSAADLTVVNLEAPIIENCPAYYPDFTFCWRPGFMAALQAAGVDVATLENNHITDYGPEGVTETHWRLEQAGIAWADRATSAIQDIRGIKFGFLAFNGVGEFFDRQAIEEQIRALRPQVDVLAVAMHWGKEYVTMPQPEPVIAPDDPREMAHLTVDAGADLVLGNHPHWVQPVELYRDKLIMYAQGNFIFGQMWSYETRVGFISRLTFYDDVLIGAELIPVLIEDYAQPVPMQGAEAQAVLDGLKAASEELAQMEGSNP